MSRFHGIVGRSFGQFSNEFNNLIPQISCWEPECVGREFWSFLKQIHKPPRLWLFGAIVFVVHGAFPIWRGSILWGDRGFRININWSESDLGCNFPLLSFIYKWYLDIITDHNYFERFYIVYNRTRIININCMILESVLDFANSHNKYTLPFHTRCLCYEQKLVELAWV